VMTEIPREIHDPHTPVAFARTTGTTSLQRGGSSVSGSSTTRELWWVLLLQAALWRAVLLERSR
jgi:hypothetical protein